MTTKGGGKLEDLERSDSVKNREILAERRDQGAHGELKVGTKVSYEGEGPL